MKAYLQNLQYAIDHGASITFQARRLVDKNRNEKYTNQYTVNTLFPNENPEEALRREFGRTYNGKEDVYIKIRVELLNLYGETTTFVMSFHFAERPFTQKMFPYKK